MKDRIEDTLKRAQAPAPDPQARLRAKRAALAEFERVQAANATHVDDGRVQALWRRWRPSREHSHGSTSMQVFRNRGWLATAAGVCVVVIGAAIVWPNWSRHGGKPSEAESVATATEPLPEELRANVAVPADAAAEAVDRSPAPTAGLTGAPTDSPQDSRDLASRSARPEPVEASPVVPVAEPEATALTTEQPAAEPQSANTPAAPPPAGPVAAKAESYAGRAGALLGDANRAQDAPQAGSTTSTVVAERRLPMNSLIKTQPHLPVPRPESAPAADDRFEHFDSNPIQRVTADNHTSTFSADVDTASYSFVRAMLMRGGLPQKDAVRSEEMINYFEYAWPAARSRGAPFAPTVVVSDSPWNAGRKLVHIGIKGYEIDREQAPDANLVLLLDVSGSMDQPDKLPLAVRSMELLLDSLKPTDTVGIVVYAGAAGTVLEPTPVRQKERILEALRSLRPGGSTAGAQGIERAYELAERHFRKGGVNRILLATDGDFNVGIHDTEQLKGFVERKREKGVYLSVLGFGQGNYRDELAQALAQNGNGVAAYIDTEREARKVLVQQASGSLFTIAKDVKLQVEFNPATVSEYRLIGYETRALKREDFNNDAVDAGDVGAGHTVTAIYEITPAGVSGSVDEPRYEGNRVKPAEGGSRDEYGFLKIRYKLPGENQSRLISEPIPLRAGDVAPAVVRDVRFSTAVAGFAQLLRGGEYTGAWTYDDVIRVAQDARGEDAAGHRAEFIELVRRARAAAR